MKYEITKGAKEEFELAPQWATLVVAGRHYSKAWISHYANGARALAFGTKDEYVIEAIHDCEIIAERRPITELVWHGEGLPPVGVRCEILWNDDWVKCVVKAYGEEQLIFKAEGSREWAGHINNYKFRPIRSPEDVARDEEIVLLTDVICGKMPDVGMATAAMFAGRVYDAGYRRPKPHVVEVQACEHKSTRPSSGGCICNDCGWRSW